MNYHSSDCHSDIHKLSHSKFEMYGILSTLFRSYEYLEHIHTEK